MIKHRSAAVPMPPPAPPSILTPPFSFVSRLFQPAWHGVHSDILPTPPFIYPSRNRYASILPSGVPPLLASLVSADALRGGRSGAGGAPVLNREEIVEVLLEAARQVCVLCFVVVVCWYTVELVVVVVRSSWRCLCGRAAWASERRLGVGANISTTI